MGPAIRTLCRRHPATHLLEWGIEHQLTAMRGAFGAPQAGPGPAWFNHLRWRLDVFFGVVTELGPLGLDIPSIFLAHRNCQRNPFVDGNAML